MLKILDPGVFPPGFFIFVSMPEKTKTANGNIPIPQWAEDDRPREKLLNKGRAALSDAELIAILIRSGNPKESAVELSKKILSLTNNNLNDLGKLPVSELKKIRGIGQAKALSIAAALELGRRRKEEEPRNTTKIMTSKDSFLVFKPFLSDLPHEEFWVLLLNAGNKIMVFKRISEGGISGTVVDAKIIFKFAIEYLASKIVLCHNHPSGDPKPSNADILLTKKLRESGKMLGINVADHIIIGDRCYFSFADEGMF
jgi:DNA repair protein RadC